MSSFNEFMEAIKADVAANGGQAHPGLLRVMTPFVDPRTNTQQIVNLDYRGMSFRQAVAMNVMAGLAGTAQHNGDTLTSTECAAESVAHADALIALLFPPPPAEPPKAEEPAGNILIAQ